MRFNQQWEGRNCASEQNPWFPATVPGNIQKDYAVFAGFADWHYADNYKQFQPLENDAWMYRTTLQYDKKEGERVFFVSEGINYRYDIALNGETVYSYEGMFRRAPSVRTPSPTAATRPTLPATRPSITAGTGTRACSFPASGTRRTSRRARRRTSGAPRCAARWTKR